MIFILFYNFQGFINNPNLKQAKRWIKPLKKELVVSFFARQNIFYAGTTKGLLIKWFLTNGQSMFHVFRSKIHLEFSHFSLQSLGQQTFGLQAFGKQTFGWHWLASLFLCFVNQMSRYLKDCACQKIGHQTLADWHLATDIWPRDNCMTDIWLTVINIASILPNGQLLVGCLVDKPLSTKCLVLKRFLAKWPGIKPVRPLGRQAFGQQTFWQSNFVWHDIWLT